MTVHRPIGRITPIQRGDVLFFGARRTRRFRARPYEAGDLHLELPGNVPLFADAHGRLAEVDLVIVKRLADGRQRMMFAAPNVGPLRTDRAIIEFLRSRGVKPGRGLSLMHR